MLSTYRLPTLVISLTAFLLGTSGAFAQLRSNPPGTGVRHTLEHEGRERAYRLHVPEGLKERGEAVPLLIVLHGGGGTAEVASRMGFTPLADEERFIVAYPEGLNKHWGDGRNSRKFAEQDAEIDDLDFILTLVEKLQQTYPLDQARIFATGASNGGFMSQRLAIEASDTVAAVAIIIATMAKPFEEAFTPEHPVSVLFMNGTDDPFVPYDGGPITPNFTPGLNRSKTDYGRGFCTSTDKAVSLWLSKNGLAEKEPTIETLPDTDPSDGCTVERRTWTGGTNNTSVVLYRIDGGGHTIPQGAQYLPERIIGKTCQDFDGVRAVWDFLKQHPKPAR